MLAHLDRLARRMDEAGLDAFVATTFENVYYLTGVASQPAQTHPHGGRCLAVVVRDRLATPYFLTSRCDVDQFLDAAVPLAGAVGFGTFHRELADDAVLTPGEQRLYDVSVLGPTPATALDALANVLREAGVAGGTVGIDEKGAPFGFLDALGDALPGTRVVPAAEDLRWVRKVKTPAEVERITASAAAAEAGIRAAVAAARPGATERELVREFELEVVRHGARPKFTLIKFGRSAVGGQQRPTDVPLRRGDGIWFDVGCVLNGYWSDLARTFALGEPDAKLARYYDAVLAGEERGIAEARPGLRGKELFDITVDGVRRAGIAHYRRHHVGHGIGVEIYEPVLITPNSEDVIEIGTVVNIETPYYEFGFGAVHVEDPFVVEPEGNRLLTTLDRGLGVLG
ncbi:M24 family metallopeptidase [Couchioplanes caeruleus]|uniref:Peptidase M24 n=2 Tax=Couchioplanes caeruleus TaxID=56438 RepID=A0A1K0FTP8_9ACTN|nr:Xaa-Pro peptidase family protein [Couchioplanes caeruleus]OJF09562.1 peptidase M24 [Couchioplanes caeruleus subsp. caeruleus]OJF16181.1 peptidase M24 [Couchioplanes caeruleus subsp. caeruleus]ROP34077.1 Xaa-Pro aminopeptidase [Couchioplanes caeruleus]